MDIFKYRKNNDNYEDGAKLYQQIINNALPIIKAFFFEYSVLFFFDNIIVYLFYIKNILQAKDINKKTSSQQA